MSPAGLIQPTLFYLIRVKSILVLSSDLRLGTPSGPFVSVSDQNYVCLCLLSLHATRLTHVLHLITKKYLLRNANFEFPHYAVFFFRSRNYPFPRGGAPSHGTVATAPAGRYTARLASAYLTVGVCFLVPNIPSAPYFRKPLSHVCPLMYGTSFTAT